MCLVQLNEEQRIFQKKIRDQNRKKGVYALIPYHRASGHAYFDVGFSRIITTADEIAEILFNNPDQNFVCFEILVNVNHDKVNVREKFKTVEQLSDHIEKYWL